MFNSTNPLVNCSELCVLIFLLVRLQIRKKFIVFFCNVSEANTVSIFKQINNNYFKLYVKCLRIKVISDLKERDDERCAEKDPVNGHGDIRYHCEAEPYGYEKGHDLLCDDNKGRRFQRRFPVAYIPIAINGTCGSVLRPLP